MLYVYTWGSDLIGQSLARDLLSNSTFVKDDYYFEEMSKERNTTFQLKIWSWSQTKRKVKRNNRSCCKNDSNSNIQISYEITRISLRSILVIFQIC